MDAPLVDGGTSTIHVDVEADPSPDHLAEWDALVSTIPGTDITQLSAWARVRRAQNFQARYLFARRGRALVAGAQLLVRSVPLVGQVAYSSYGPLIAETEDAGHVADVLAQAMAALHGVRMLFIQPAEGREDVRQALLRHGLRPSTAGIAPTGSARLDLHQDEDAIHRNLPRRLRSTTRHWAERGVTVRVGDASDVPVLAALLRSAADTCGYGPPPGLGYLQHLYSTLAPSGTVALFVGEVHGVPVAADLVTACGDTVRTRLGGLDRSGDGRRLSVPAAVYLETARWARTAGYRWLDLGGISEATLRDAVDRGLPHRDTWPGADRAKLAIGATAFRYPGPVELIRPAPVRTAYRALSGSEWGRAALSRTRARLRSGPGAVRVQRRAAR